MRPRMLLAEPVRLQGPEARAAQVTRLRADFPGWQVDEAEAADDSAYPWHEVEALTCMDFPAVGVAAMPRLRLVQTVTTGVERLPVAELDAAGVRVCNAAGTSAPEIAEFVLARILEDAKRLGPIREAQAEHRWWPAYGESVRGAALLLVGFGAINQAVAELARAFGMTVRVARRSAARPLPDGVAEQGALTDLGRLLAGARYVVCALPETPATMRLLDAEAIDRIADGALLVNVGRGSVLDEQALAAACASGRIRAALDVFDEEPLPAGSPWWSTPGVAVSAHCASVPGEALRAVADLFVQNLRRLLDDAPLTNQVAGPAGPRQEFT